MKSGRLKIILTQKLIKEKHVVKNEVNTLLLLISQTKFWLFFLQEVVEFCIIFTVSVVGAPVGIAGTSFILIFFNNRNNQETTEYNKKQKKKKHDEIHMRTKSKLNSIETLVSQALSDMEISHEKFITILKEKDTYEKMKGDVRNSSEKQENMRLYIVNSRS